MHTASSNDIPATRTLLELAALEQRDYHATLQRILQADAEALDVGRVSYWGLSDDARTLTNELLWDSRLSAFESGARLREADYPSYFRAIRAEQVILAHDARQDPRTRELEDYTTPLGITSMMDVPVWARGRLVGVLCHEHTGPPRQWTTSECDLSLAVAQTIATAHEASARNEAEKLARRALFLSRAAEVLSENLELDEVPHHIAQLAVDELADWCVLEEIDPWGQLRVLAAMHRDRRSQTALLDLLSQKTRRTARGHFAVRVLESGRPLLFPTVDDRLLRRFGIAGEEATSLIRRCGAKSLLLVPLAARGRVSAAITLVSTGRSLGREDLALAEDFARRAAVHLDNVRLYREAREAIRARDEFIAVASHELNTPLTSLGLSVDALQRGLLSASPDATVRAAELVQRQQRRLTRLVREMLDVTRIQSRRLVLRREPMSLSDTVREVCAAFEPSFTSAGTSLRLKVERDVRGRWDRARLERVVENLLSNALKFGQRRPVDVSLRARAEGAELRVTDQGIGIPLERQRYIFDRFERAVSAKEYAGLGLGLYISRGIVQAHGGDIDVKSRPGRGTTFTVRLPWSGEPSAPPPSTRAP